MAAIRGANTKPEMMIRRGLHARGFRFRLHVRDIPGKPDLVFPKYRAVVFVHGCFWHGHDCALFRFPDTRREFWREKIERNRRRDSEVSGLLSEAGWRQLTVWECAIRGNERIGFDRALDKVVGWLKNDSVSAEIRGEL